MGNMGLVGRCVISRYTSNKLIIMSMIIRVVAFSKNQIILLISPIFTI